MKTKHFGVFSILFILFSCKIYNNLPLDNKPNDKVSTNITKIFVDKNGNFYPDNWTEFYSVSCSNIKKCNDNNTSLLRTAYKENNYQKLINLEDDFLESLKIRLKSKKRIFILVHGYNNNTFDSFKSYKKIDSILQMKPFVKFHTETDEIIHFNWDGLYASTMFDSKKIWNIGVGNSQLAGEFGLRRVLNIFNNKEIVIISHSRGASVVLSALSNPPYNDDYKTERYKIHTLKIGNSIGLAENRNIIKCFFVAPAVGLVDFRNIDYHSKIKDTSFRKFSNQVKKIHITINKSDRVLKKYFLGLFASKFNPTDLGYNITVFNTLKANHPNANFFNYTIIKKQNSHDFNCYIEHDSFSEILEPFLE